MATWALVALFLGLFTMLSWEFRGDPAFLGLDTRILKAVETLRTPSRNGVAVDITALGSPTVITMIVVFGALILAVARDWLAAIHLIAASIGAGLWVTFVKHSIGRTRPEIIPRLVEVSGFSYPSGHALTAAALYMTVAVLATRAVQDLLPRALFYSLASLVIFAVSFSRVYLGVHYPSDTISGTLLGVAWALSLGALLSGPHRKRLAKLNGG